MAQRSKQNTEPWDDRVYGTGNTKPPKNHGGLIAMLLVVVIFLSGITSALSLMNIRLFRALKEQEKEDSYPMSFSASKETSPAIIFDNAPDLNSLPGKRDVFLDLKQSPQSLENFPQGEANALSLQDIYAKTIDSVVSVTCTNDAGTIAGSGVILSARGYIVTTRQLVDGAETITVQLTDGRSFSGVVIGADALTDLAVLYIDAADLQPAEFGNSSSLRVGDTVVAIGDPMGTDLRGSMISGYISAINQDVSFLGRSISLIQTGIAMNEGSSGGPLINCYGQIIGINTTKIGTYGEDPSIDALNFSIPSTTVQEVVNQLIAQGYVSGRPSLGIRCEAVSVFDQHYFQLPPGVYVTQVHAYSDAASQGVGIGDILLSVDGIHIASPEELDTLVYGRKIGETVTVVLYHGGEEMSLVLTLEEDIN